MAEVIREDVIQVTVKTDSGGLDKLKEDMDGLKASVSGGLGFDKLTDNLKSLKVSLSNLSMDNIVGGIKDDVKAFDTTLAGAKTKLKGLIDGFKQLQDFSPKDVITHFKELNRVKVDNLKSGVIKIRDALGDGEKGAKGFKTVLSNIGKVTVANVATGINKIKEYITGSTPKAKELRTRLKEVAVTSLDRLKSGFESLKTAVNSVAGSVKQFTSNLKSQISSAADSIKSSIFNLKNLIAGVVIGKIGSQSLDVVVDRQNITSQFEVLLGGAEKAQKRVQELTDFAGMTPYTRDEIFAASKQLQVFTGNALSVGEGLRVIGDVAAGTGQPFQDVALWTGRLYDALKSGRPVGEATARLQEMGAISGEDRAKIEALVSSGASIGQKWAEVETIFSRYNGTMEKLSNNLGNMLTSLKSFTTNNLLLPIGEGITAGLQPAIRKFREFRKASAEDIDAMGKVLRDFVGKICVPLFSAIESGAEKLIKAFAGLKDGFSGLRKMAGDSPFFNALIDVMEFISSNKAVVISALQGITMAMAGILVADKVVKLATAFKWIISPLGMIVTAATLMFMVFKNGTGTVNDFVTGLSGKFQAFIPMITDGIRKMTSAIVQGLPELTGIIGNVVINLAQSIMTLVPSIVNSITSIAPVLQSTLTDLVTRLANTLLDMVPQLIECGTQFFLGLIQGSIQALPKMVNQAAIIIENLVNAVTQALPLIIQSGIQIVNELINGVVQNLPGIVDAGLRILDALLEGIVTNLPVIINGAIQMINSLVAGLLDNLPKIISAAQHLIQGLCEGLIQNLPTIIQSGVQLILGLVNALIDNIGLLVQGAVQLVIGLAMGIIDNLPIIVSAAVEIIVALAFGLIEAIPTLLSVIPEIFSAFIKGIFSVNWLEVGWNLIKAIIGGVWEGLKSLGKSVWNGIKNIFSGGDVEAEARTTGFDTGTSYTSGIAEGLTAAQVETKITGIATSESFAAGLTSGKKTVASAATGLSQETSKALGITVAGTTESAEEVAKQIMDSFELLTTKLEELPGQLKGILDPIERVAERIVEIPKAFVDAVQQTDLMPSGVMMIEGLISGINSQRDEAVSVARSIAEAINKEFDKVQDIHSPSGVWKTKGEYLIMGGIQGIKNKLPLLESTINQVGEYSIPYSGHYTPESTTTSYTTRNSTYENNTYAPSFNITISANDDRTMARKVKRWVTDSINETFEGLSRKSQLVREV